MVVGSGTQNEDVQGVENGEILKSIENSLYF